MTPPTPTPEASGYKMSDGTHEKVALSVDELQVVCPDCGEDFIVSYKQRDDGTWQPSDDDKFTECTACLKMIEVIGIRIIEAP